MSTAAEALAPPDTREGRAMRGPIAAGTSRPAVIGRLKHRADFVRVGKGKRWHGKAFSLQAARSDVEGSRVGLTLTRKVGNAVIRNRARRRLREALRLAASLPARDRHDYVIVGRIEAIRLPFETLKSELSRAIGAVHDEARGQSRRSRPAQEPRLKP